MKKQVRKLITLSLALVFICTCAAAAFAGSDSIDDPGVYGNTYLDGTLVVDRYIATAVLTLEPADEVKSASISTTYDIYYPREDNNSLPGDHFTSSGYSATITGEMIRLNKNLDSEIYYGFAFATATFKATIESSSATIYFHPETLEVYSGLFPET